MLTVLLVVIAGAVAAAFMACVPGLHVYNVLAVAIVAWHAFAPSGAEPAGLLLAAGTAAMLVSFAVVNTIPSVLLAAPDESAVFTVLPGQKYLMQGRGHDAVMLTVAGSLGGLILLIGVLAPLATRTLPTAHRIMQPHQHWMLWCIIAFMLMSEWPKGGNRGQAGWRRFADACRTTGAGLIVFLLSGLLGFVLFYRSPVSYEVAFQNLMPAFVGLFTLPWLLLNLATDVTVPEQHPRTSPGLTADNMVKGTLAGTLGGGFAAFLPAVTGGVGGLLAGHASAIRDDKVFLVSQGASKVAYYVGGFLLLFVPGLNMVRGGAAWMLRPVYVPHDRYTYVLILAAIALAGSIACLLVSPLTRLTLRVIARVGYRRLSAAAAVVAVGIVAAMTGLPGLAVLLVATGIGLMPVLYGSRRMNCLGVILLPIACNLSGVGSHVARALGLL